MIDKINMIQTEKFVKLLITPAAESILLHLRTYKRDRKNDQQKKKTEKLRKAKTVVQSLVKTCAAEISNIRRKESQTLIFNALYYDDF